MTRPKTLRNMSFPVPVQGAGRQHRRACRTRSTTVTSYQQRSDAILTHLLGRSYRATDVLFYLAGGAAALGCRSALQSYA